MAEGDTNNRRKYALRTTFLTVVDFTYDQTGTISNRPLASMVAWIGFDAGARSYAGLPLTCLHLSDE